VIASIFTSEETTGQERCPSPTLGQDAECGGGIRSPSQLLGQIDERGCMPKAIILAPTRELACQIHTESKKLCHNSDMKTVVVYGGSDIRAQLAELSTGCDMIVATPGRLNDLVDRGVVSFCKVIFLVLDEADRMLDMGFEVSQHSPLFTIYTCLHYWHKTIYPTDPLRDTKSESRSI
jgi:DEAD/DEAH box helicase